ncbi:hypothetical protein ACFQY0_19755 [Haloferula chungangensis]|uniref:Uncharacterized protein n=1 Tax=Haloferula chungangensis TaxID=1048331 RepID=A0ABW2LAG5_9BACT
MLRILSILLLTTLTLFAHPHEDLPVDASEEARLALAKAKKFGLSEGLPHPAKETERFSAEAQRRDTQQITGFFFYKPDQKLDPATTDKLRQIIADSDNLTEWKEHKTCGGFHPDWSLNWRRGWSKDHALICFSCDEIIYISGDFQLRYNLTPAASKQLKTLLNPFQSKRPAQ